MSRNMYRVFHTDSKNQTQYRRLEPNYPSTHHRTRLPMVYQAVPFLSELEYRLQDQSIAKVYFLSIHRY